jgi:outer membrane beta-barrel protein
MENWLHGIFLKRLSIALLACMTLGSAAAFAVDDQDAPIIDPGISRREIKTPHISSADFELGAYAGVISVEDFGSSPVYGLRGAYHITEDLFAEGAYGRSTVGKTSYETLSGAARVLTDAERVYSYYNISLGYNLLPGEAFIGSKHAFNSALYVIAGVGSTNFANDSRFTVNFGTGYRFLATDWLALHVDVRDHVFSSDLLGTSKTTHNLEFTGGMTVFF